jgi:flagellar basal body-associated protein FliL
LAIALGILVLLFICWLAIYFRKSSKSKEKENQEKPEQEVPVNQNEESKLPDPPVSQGTYLPPRHLDDNTTV